MARHAPIGALRMKHSPRVLQVGAAPTDDGGLTAVWSCSCECGWQTDERFTRYADASIVYHAHRLEATS